MRLGWVGTGLMGAPMVSRLLAEQYEVSVHARRPDSVTHLLDAGATWSESPLACASSSDVVFLMLPDSAAVDQVLNGPGGVLNPARPAPLIVDMSTIGPSAAVKLSLDVEAAGGSFLDAPVSGGPLGAENGTLAVMVGGPRSDFDRVHGIFEVLGVPVYVGPAGAGQRAKLVNQTVIAGTMAGVSEAFCLADRFGLDLDTMLSVLSQGIAHGRLLEWAWPKLVDGDFAPGFKISHMTKDLDLVIDAAAADGLGLPVAAEVLRLYSTLDNQMGAALGTQALVQAVDARQSQENS